MGLGELPRPSLSWGPSRVPPPQDLSRKDCLEAPGSGLGDLPPASSKLSSSPSAVGTLKRPTSLSRHASAAGFPLTAGTPRAMPKGHKTPTSYSPMEGGEGLFIDVEDISQLLTDVARFADALENLRDVVLRDGGCRGGAGSGQRGWGTTDPPLTSPPPAQPHGSASPRGTGLQGTGDEGSNGDMSRSTPSPGAEPDPWGGGGSALSGRGPGPLGAAQSQRAAGGGWLLGARSQDNAASCLRAIFIRLLSCLHSSGASCLPGPPAPVGHRARPRTPGPASLGQPSGWGQCPGAGAGLGGTRGWGLGASRLPGGEGSSDLVFPAARWGCRGSHGALFSALALQNTLTHPHLSWKTWHCLVPAAGAERTRGSAQPGGGSAGAMPPGPAKP